MTPTRKDLPTDVAGFAHAQSVARRAADSVMARLEEGVTEKDVVAELEAQLRREGVRSWLHRPFVWFGDRSGFLGFRFPWDFFPTSRRLKKDEVLCADMAPVVDGYAADYGWSTLLGDDPDYAPMRAFDEGLRDRMVSLLSHRPSARELVKAVRTETRAAGYQVRDTMYPFGILGHRLERVRSWDRFAVGRPFQLPTIGLHLAQMARGTSPFLNESNRQELRGVWAVQPHVANERFGLKFEDLLWVHDTGAVWLSRLD